MVDYDLLMRVIYCSGFGNIKFTKLFMSLVQRCNETTSNRVVRSNESHE